MRRLVRTAADKYSPLIAAHGSNIGLTSLPPSAHPSSDIYTLPGAYSYGGSSAGITGIEDSAAAAGAGVGTRITGGKRGRKPAAALLLEDNEDGSALYGGVSESKGSGTPVRTSSRRPTESSSSGSAAAAAAGADGLHQSHHHAHGTPARIASILKGGPAAAGAGAGAGSKATDLSSIKESVLPRPPDYSHPLPWFSDAPITYARAHPLWTLMSVEIDDGPDAVAARIRGAAAGPEQPQQQQKKGGAKATAKEKAKKGKAAAAPAPAPAPAAAAASSSLSSAAAGGAADASQLPQPAAPSPFVTVPCARPCCAYFFSSETGTCVRELCVACKEEMEGANGRGDASGTLAVLQFPRVAATDKQPLALADSPKGRLPRAGPSSSSSSSTDASSAEESGGGGVVDEEGFDGICRGGLLCDEMG